MAARTNTAKTAAQTLVALRRYHGMSETKLGKLTGYSRSQINERGRGVTSMDADDMDLFGQAFGCPPSVFFMDPGEALLYVLTNNCTPGDVVIPPRAWNADDTRELVDLLR